MQKEKDDYRHPFFLARIIKNNHTPHNPNKIIANIIG